MASFLSQLYFTWEAEPYGALPAWAGPTHSVGNFTQTQNRGATSRLRGPSDFHHTGPREGTSTASHESLTKESLRINTHTHPASSEHGPGLWLTLLKEHPEHPGCFCRRRTEGMVSSAHSQRLAMETAMDTDWKGQQRLGGISDCLALLTLCRP